jgi:hypothetical protein
MCPSPVALDTNVVLEGHFMRWLRNHHTLKVISPVAYAELAFGYVTRYGTTERLDSMLYKTRIRVEQYKMAQAKQTATYVRELIGATKLAPGTEEFKRAWNKAWRDSAVASQAAISPWRLLTMETNGFPFLGWRAKNPYEFKRQVEQGIEERRELGEEDE